VWRYFSLFTLNSFQSGTSLTTKSRAGPQDKGCKQKEWVLLGSEETSGEPWLYSAPLHLWFGSGSHQLTQHATQSTHTDLLPGVSVFVMYKKLLHRYENNIVNIC
jgi:hypothetical protein